ncbi:hypothetical protein PG985_011798 [Apiospora marii]|uniref:uncharacterized protein n=1 Tax=Apiospora marii TaxID=335849 RepID=UPI0031306408
MADTPHKSTKRVTRAAAATSGSQTTAASGSGGAAAAPAQLTSGDLKYRPMRVWQRRQRVNVVVKEQLKETAFIFLGDENVKQQLLMAIDKCLTDDINTFMDNSPPRALYPYATRAHSAIMTVFRDNLGVFKGIGVSSTNEQGQRVDSFDNVIDEPVLEELFYKEEDFFQNIAVPDDDSDDEMEDAPASGKD